MGINGSPYSSIPGDRGGAALLPLPPPSPGPNVVLLKVNRPSGDLNARWENPERVKESKGSASWSSSESPYAQGLCSEKGFGVLLCGGDGGVGRRGGSGSVSGGISIWAI